MKRSSLPRRSLDVQTMHGRLIAGDRSPEVVDPLVAGLLAWERSGRTRSLERCIGYPTEQQQRREIFAYHLRQAHEQERMDDPRDSIERLARKYRAFLAGSQLVHWKRSGGPSPDVPEQLVHFYEMAQAMSIGFGTSGRSFARMLRARDGEA